MNQLTQRYLISRFKEYYLMASMQEPPGLTSREWGFIYFDGEGMRRHKAFNNRSELVDYIRATVPAHVYHSAAYYRMPAAPTMREKLWIGADLIFDLDADHLKKVPNTYKEMLALVKVETQKLLDFLMNDFGFSSADISVVFSGGRGYHIHVRDPKVMSLRSDARREVVDYLTGRGLDLDRFFLEVPVGGDCGVERAFSLKGPAWNAPGWGGRINHAIQSFVLYLQKLPEDEAKKLLTGVKGIGYKKASTFYDQICDPRIIEMIKNGNLDVFKGSSNLWKVLIRYLEGEGIQIVPFIDDMKGETDEPVTADIKRLIRFPDSLHGGSGMRVTPLSLDVLKSFDPLKDAVVFGSEEVLVDVMRPSKVQMKGNTFDLQPGPATLPAYAAIYLMARGLAELGDRTTV